MFFKDNRIDLMAKLILSTSAEEREEALKKMFEFQKQDFLAIFRLMGGKHVTLRLLDPPLSEFLPNAKSANFNRYRHHHHHYYYSSLTQNQRPQRPSTTT